MLQRLKSDYDLAIVTLFGGCAALGILPFALYRLATGEYLIALVDAAIVLSLVVAVTHAWRSGDASRAGLFMAAVNTLGCTAIVLLFGRHGLFWAYVVLGTNFFLTTRQAAAIANILMLAILIGHSALYASNLEMITFAVTSGLVTLYSFIFALRTARQREVLEKLATHDALTGIGNRRLLETELARAGQIQARGGQDFGLAVFDIDHFKRVNDNFGHDVGDRVLKDYVRIVSRNTRKQDRLFRLGGEEFVLLMPDTDGEKLVAAIAHVHDRLREQLRGPDGPVSVSIGGARLRPGENWSDWLNRADAALYAAKRGGRNRAVVDHDDGDN